MRPNPTALPDYRAIARGFLRPGCPKLDEARRVLRPFAQGAFLGQVPPTREAWEALLSLGLVEEQRRYVEGNPFWDSVGKGEVSDLPSTWNEAVVLASDPAGMRRAEQLWRESSARLEALGLPPLDEPSWCVLPPYQAYSWVNTQVMRQLSTFMAFSLKPVGESMSWSDENPVASAMLTVIDPDDAASRAWGQERPEGYGHRNADYYRGYAARIDEAALWEYEARQGMRFPLSEVSPWSGRLVSDFANPMAPLMSLLELGYLWANPRGNASYDASPSRARATRKAPAVLIAPMPQVLLDERI